MSINALIPTHENTGIARKLILRWEWVGEGTPIRYEVYFSDDEQECAELNYRAYRGDVTKREYDPVIPLTYGKTYYWRIVAVTLSGETEVKTPSVAVEYDAGPPEVQEVLCFSFTVMTAPTSLESAKYATLPCVASDNKFWYLNDGNLVALSGLTLDTSRPITMFEAFQRVFIINGMYKKVVDFVNTKLTVDGMQVPPTRGDVIVSTGGAQMLVDFVPQDKSAIYGTVLAGVFEAGHTLSGGTLSPASTSITAVSAPTTPHYYDWEPYADINTTLEFGAVPDFIFAGCLFMGSILFGNNPVDPHFWGMTRQGNPFDFAYGADDAQSATAAAGPRAGKIGDRVLTFVPLSADYVLIGCSRSWMIMRGLPAAGGMLDLLDDTVGIIDKDAWCKGVNGELFFVAKTGLYVIQGLNKPRPLTHDVLPRFAEEMGLNPDTQRITMGYDRNRHGLVISAVTTETGENKQYWFDLHTGGFFPEVYPPDMSPFSQMFYEAENPDDRHLLFGCKDGYIRRFDDAAKSDCGAAIESHVLIGPQRIGTNDSREGLINDLQIVTAGGEPVGKLPDSDKIHFEIYAGDSAESCVEKALWLP